jgi:hypothetical protein
MMTRICTPLLSLLSLVILSGCIESSTVIQVRKDGSGAIHVREFISNEALSMMGGIESMAAQTAVVDEEETIEGVSDLPVFLQGMVRERAGEYGANVRLVAVREAENDRGWQGYMARFEFDDINAVRLATMAAPDGEEGSMESEYRFQFTPGETAVLRLVPAGPPMPPAAMEPGPDDLQVADMDFGEMDIDFEGLGMDELPDFDMDFSGMMNGMEDAMGAMFGNLFKGMRMSMFVEVEGEIVDTDAMHRSESRPNRVALVDVNMDELMAHPEALTRMMSNDPQSVYQLQAEGAPGLLMEDPEKEITIRFR